MEAEYKPGNKEFDEDERKINSPVPETIPYLSIAAYLAAPAIKQAKYWKQVAKDLGWRDQRVPRDPRGD